MPENISLRSCHIIVPGSLVERIFQGSESAFVSYNVDQNKILVSPTSNSWFPKLHQSKEYLIKDKDIHGTKSIGIRELLIDEELQEDDRELSFEVNLEKRFLKLNLE